MAAQVQTPQWCKILIVGDSNVGKRSFFLRVRNGEFIDTSQLHNMTEMDNHLEYPMKIGNSEIMVSLKCLTLSECVEKLQALLHVDLHSTDRTERNMFRHLRNADAVILMYSVEDRYTLVNLPEWHEEISCCVPDIKKIVIAVVGSKNDLVAEIEPETIECMCQNFGTSLSFFTSAKTGEGVKEALEGIVKEVHRLKKVESEVNLTPEIKPRGSRCS